MARVRDGTTGISTLIIEEDSSEDGAKKKVAPKKNTGVDAGRDAALVGG